MNAASGDFNPKNKIDHKVFNPSCIPKKVIAFFFNFDFLIQTRYNEMPISTNKLIHTGENIQLGGVKEGLLIVVYHVFVAGAVKIEPIIPASWQITMADISLIMFFGFININ